MRVLAPRNQGSSPFTYVRLDYCTPSFQTRRVFARTTLCHSHFSDLDEATVHFRDSSLIGTRRLGWLH